MKKRMIGGFILLVVLLGMINVSAKDTVYSLNKYSEEILLKMEDSYNDIHELDGIMAAGAITKTKAKEKDKDIILIKYKKNGTTSWNYIYEKKGTEELLDLKYTYDLDNKIDGYLLVIQEEESTIQFHKIDLEGNLVWVLPSSLEEQEKIVKIEPLIEEEMVQGYIAISNTNTNAYLNFYDKDMNLLWKKEYQEENSKREFQDIIIVENNYIILEKITKEEETKVEIVKTDLKGDNIETIITSLEKYTSTNFIVKDNSFILYGVTPEVKLKKGDKSYYLIKYSLTGEEEWESIGEVSIEENEIIELKLVEEGYYLLYKNPTDSSYEVTKIDKDGLFEKKVKKIINNYYDFESFTLQKNVLYFVGQINCPDDDNCDYDNNSLFLVSDEDKVIEVEDKDSTNILLIIGIIMVGLGVLIYYKRKNKKDER